MKKQTWNGIAKKASAALTASAMLFGMSLMMPVPEAAAASDVVVNTEIEYQTIQGFGGINHPEWTGSDLSASQRRTAFGNGDNELGFTVLRVFVNPNKNEWYKALETAKYAQQQGAVIFASPWEPPASMAEGGGNSGKLHLRHDSYAAYAAHLNDFVHYMKDNGVELYAISVQNEPDYAHDWTAWTSDETTDFLANYADKIDCRVMSPETFQYTNKDYYSKILNNAKAFANCDLFGTHMYGTLRSQMDFPALESCGKPIWMTEVYVPNSDANSNNRWPESLQVSQNMHNALVVGNMSAYVWWYIRRSYSPMNEDGTISKRGYCMAQFSKYVRPGDVRIDVTEQPADNVLVSAYKNDEGEIKIVAVNQSSTEITQRFTIRDGDIADVDRYRTSASENLAPTLDMECSGDSFYSQLPANSVSTYVVTLSGNTPEPDENGYFYHSTFESDADTWEGHGGAAVAVNSGNAYAGSGSLLVSDRSSAWNGAERKLSTKVFVPGQEYSFSTDVMYLDGPASQNIFMKLQYTGSDGEVHYSSIAEAPANKGAYVQLANTNYQIPEGAKDMRIYIETESDTSDLYLDEAIGALPGTVVEGPAPVPPVSVIKGDVNFDGRINILDLVAAKRGTVKGFDKSDAADAADVNGDGENTVSDIVALQKFLLAQITEFPVSKVNIWDSYQETANAEMQKFYGDAICQMGNTARLVDKIEKAQAGENVTIAYLGGSITEGVGLGDASYARRSYQYFADTFGTGSNVSYINAGMSGTSSVVGLMRAQNDVLSQNPDVIFIEFSVNDHPEEIYKTGFESLVKQCLSQKNEPAVIILINRAKGGYSMQEQMEAVGKNYNVPVLSMDNALTNAFNSGLLTKEDYYSDEYHPHADGNALISDSIAYFYRQALKTENRSSAYTIPSATVYGDTYASTSIVPLTELSGLKTGSFIQGRTNTRFPYSFTYNKNSGNTPLTFTAQGKGVCIVFKSNQNSSLGNLQVTVNGHTSSISGNRPYAWGGADADVAYIQDTSGQLDVSIQMENANTDFEIWGIGIVK